MLLEPDGGQIETFFDALFRHSGHEGYASMRAFLHSNKALSQNLWFASLNNYRNTIGIAVDMAHRAANTSEPAVFCPPIAVFNGSSRQAREQDLYLGLAISVECDKRPDEARQRLQEILGPATAIVKSGGQWNNEAGEPEDKLHLHWRLAQPAKGPDLERLKRARAIATLIVGGDPSNVPTVHCLRWPGSWHRKDKDHPRLCEFFSCSPDREIDLDEAVAALEAAAPPQQPKGNGRGGDDGDGNDWQTFYGNIQKGDNLHQSLRDLAAKLVAAGTTPGAVVNQLRALMEASAAPRDDRWKARFDDIPRLVNSAERKVEQERHPPRPTITLRVGETERAVNELDRLLVASQRGLYQRGGLIVATGFAKMQTWDGKTVVGQIIEDRGDYALIEDAEAVADFVRLDADGNPRPAPAPMALVRTLKDRKHRLKLPVLVALVNCPSISADGKLLDQPGFDPATGILYNPLDVEFPRVPHIPSKRMAETALGQVLRLLETFDFVSRDDRAVALSLIFTAVARRGLNFVPLHGFDAPVAGSGKSMLVDIASILATGHEAGVIAQGESREEAEKRLSAILMRGDPLIAIDNCELPLEGVVLNQALTQHWLDLRILGYSKMLRTAAKPLISATGNNLVVKGDLTRRSLVGRLDPKCERPELREFAYDPIADAKERRAELVVAILTALLAYHAAGRPNRPRPPLQSFVPWSDTVRGALIWLGQGDPVKTMDRVRQTDPTLANLKTVLTAWRDEFADSPTTVSAAVATANATIATPEPGTLGYVRSFTHPALRDALLVVAGRGGAIDTRLMGQWLSKYEDRVVNLGRDEAKPDFAAFSKAGVLHGLLQWRVVGQPAGGLGG